MTPDEAMIKRFELVAERSKYHDNFLAKIAEIQKQCTHKWEDDSDASNSWTCKACQKTTWKLPDALQALKTKDGLEIRLKAGLCHYTKGKIDIFAVRAIDVARGYVTGVLIGTNEEVSYPCGECYASIDKCVANEIEIK